jgi:hypothetical protein
VGTRRGPLCGRRGAHRAAAGARQRTTGPQSPATAVRRHQRSARRRATRHRAGAGRHRRDPAARRRAGADAACRRGRIHPGRPPRRRRPGAGATRHGQRARVVAVAALPLHEAGEGRGREVAQSGRALPAKRRTGRSRRPGHAPRCPASARGDAHPDRARRREHPRSARLRRVVRAALPARPEPQRASGVGEPNPRRRRPRRGSAARRARRVPIHLRTRPRQLAGHGTDAAAAAVDAAAIQARRYRCAPAGLREDALGHPAADPARRRVPVGVPRRRGRAVQVDQRDSGRDHGPGLPLRQPDRCPAQLDAGGGCSPPRAGTTAASAPPR